MRSARRQADHLQRPRDPRARFIFAHSRQRQGQCDVFLGGQNVKQMKRLKDQANALTTEQRALIFVH